MIIELTGIISTRDIEISMGGKETTMKERDESVPRPIHIEDDTHVE